MLQPSLKYGLLICIASISWLSSLGQNFSSFGTDFYIPFSPHFSGTQANMGIYITANQAASGTVQVGTATIPFSVAAGESRRLFIGPGAGSVAPNTEVYLNQRDGIKANAGIKVNSNTPVTVYAHIINNFNSAATLTLPVNTWGTQYIAPGIEGTGRLGQPFLSIIAREPNTTVEIVPKTPVFNNDRPIGQPFQITLANPGDVYQIQFASGTDISGTTITSIATDTTDACKTIGVFSGNTWSGFGCENGVGRSNLYQQLFPVNTWGEIFFAQPMALQRNNLLRVYSLTPGTVVDIFNGLERIDKTIGPEGFVVFDVKEPVQITASAPVMAIQFMLPFNCDTRNSNLCVLDSSCPFPSNPNMVILNPATQYLDTISIFSALRQWVPPGQSKVNRAYLSISIPDAGVANFRINGAPPTGSFVTIPGTGYSTLLENVTALAATNPVHLLTSTVPFSCIAHGVGIIESYAYNAGTRLKDLRNSLRAFSTQSILYDTFCNNQAFRLQLEIPFTAARIEWLADTARLAVQLPDRPDSFFLNTRGDSIFVYRSGINPALFKTGLFTLKALVRATGSISCTGLQEVNGTFTLLPVVQSGFSITDTICAGESFTALSNTTGASQNTIWGWQTSNGIQGNGDSFSATLTQPGLYTIKQWATGQLTCPGDTAFRNVWVRTLPEANFAPLGIACNGQPVTLQHTDARTNLIRTWTINNAADSGFLRNITIINPVQGNLTASLQVRDSVGCRSNVVTRTIRVEETPVTAFRTPGICLNDAIATFTNASTFSAGQNVLSYVWNFGNALAPPATNTSTLLNPNHTYSDTGNYNVRLIARAPTGCADTSVQVFTVNGDNPRAGFQLADSPPYCSNKQVAIINRSAVSFGNITRLVWYWNWPSAPNDTTEADFPAIGDTFRHIYTLPPNQGSATFTIRLVAFSGLSCQKDTNFTITIFATPVLQFDSLPALCTNAEPIALIQARTTNGVAGAGVYSGTGVTGNLLNPSQIPAGQSPVLYAFTSSTGCQAEAIQLVTINPAPQVNAGPDKTIIAGGSTRLEGSINAGSGSFSVQWSPPTGISNPQAEQPLASPPQTTVFTLTASSAGCTASDSMVLTVQLLPSIPNTFSPNGDGINDVWLIRNLSSYPDVRVFVFDRYGQAILNSTGYTIPWDGTRNGKPVPAGVYYFVIESRAGKIKQSGSVTVIR
jgi:gliding motility-associated-like protein